MWIVYFFAVGAYTVTFWAIGLVWLVALVVPYFIIGGLIAYFVVRSARVRAGIASRLERDAQSERALNQQEQNAWESAIKGRQRNAERRTRALKKFDSRNSNM